MRKDSECLARNNNIPLWLRGLVVVAIFLAINWIFSLIVEWIDSSTLNRWGDLSCARPTPEKITFRSGGYYIFGSVVCGILGLVSLVMAVWALGITILEGIGIRHKRGHSLKAWINDIYDNLRYEFGLWGTLVVLEFIIIGMFLIYYAFFTASAPHRIIIDTTAKSVTRQRIYSLRIAFAEIDHIIYEQVQPSDSKRVHRARVKVVKSNGKAITISEGPPGSQHELAEIVGKASRKRLVNEIRQVPRVRGIFRLLLRLLQLVF